MAIQPTRPIYDLLINIQNFETYPYKEGQVYFASDKNQLLVDSNGQRASQAKLSSIGVLDSVTEIYEKGLKGFEGQILTAKTSNGYRLFYVDNEAQVHNLTFTAEDVSGLVEDGFQGGSLQFTGVWKTSRQYFADELRTSVVKSGSNYYYATATHTSGTFATDLTDKKWAKFSVQFDSVATNLLLADNAVISTTLTIGTEGTDIGKIRSANAISLNSGSGFYLSNENNGVFRVGNPNSGFLRWDGSSLRAGGFTLTNDNLFASGGNFSVSLSSIFDQSAPGSEDWITPGLTVTGTFLGGDYSKTQYFQGGIFNTNISNNTKNLLINGFQALTNNFATTSSITLQAGIDFILRAGVNNSAGRIYIRSGLTGYTTDTLLGVGTTAQPSTKLIKTDIEQIPEEDIIDLFDKINIVKYKNQFTNQKTYSLIIEDELENQNELFASLIKREEGIYRFEKEEDIPDFLKQYIGTETLEFKNNAYYFNPLTYDTFGLWNLTVQAIKINQKKIKDLEERLSLLENK